MKLLLYWVIVLALVLVCREEPIGIELSFSEESYDVQNEADEFVNENTAEENLIESETWKTIEWITYESNSEPLLLSAGRPIRDDQ